MDILSEEEAVARLQRNRENPELEEPELDLKAPRQPRLTPPKPPRDYQLKLLRKALRPSVVPEPTITTIRSIRRIGSDPSTKETPITPVSEILAPVDSPVGAPAPPAVELPKGAENSAAQALRAMLGGWRRMFEVFARMDLGPHDPRMLIILAWNGLSNSAQKRTTPEALCRTVGITPGRLIGLVAESLHETEKITAGMMRDFHQTKLVGKAVKLAGRRDGYKHMEMLFKSSGFLPTPTGNRTDISVAAVAGSRSSAHSGRLDEALESMEDDTAEFTELIRGNSGDHNVKSPSSFVTDEFRDT